MITKVIVREDTSNSFFELFHNLLAFVLIPRSKAFGMLVIEYNTKNGNTDSYTLSVFCPTNICSLIILM